jgi:glycosyltransferase involved in cell wall biosynthesis
VKVARIYHSGVVSDWRQRDRLLRSTGTDVTLISPKRWDEGGQVVRLDDGDDFVRPASTVGKHPYRFAYDPRVLSRAIRERPDIIDVHEEPASLAGAEVLLVRWLCRRTSIPIVFYSAQNIYKRYPPPFRWFERAFLRRASAAYVCNSEAVEVLRRKGFAGTIEVIPLGVDRERFSAEVQTARGPSSGYVVGYVGRLEAHKGVDVLLHALSRVPDARLEVVGNGPERRSLEKLVSELHLDGRVRFLGSAEHGSIAAAYRRFDVLAVPSLTTSAWKEQFGRVAAEAMSVGTPVVASNSGSLPDVVGPAGLLVGPGDPVALAAALRELMDPSRRAELGRAAARWAEQFSWDAVAALHARLYRNVLAAANA